jgi:hypothetical protein
VKASNPTKAESSTPNTLKFKGTDNPRHLRVIQALMARPRRREDVDDIAGCSNGPDLIATLRGLGLKVPCERIGFIDCDGYECRPGVYSFTSKDRRLVWAWQTDMRKARNVKQP